MMARPGYWTKVPCSYALDQRFLRAGERARTSSILRLLAAKQHGDSTWARASWAVILGEYADTLDELIELGFLIQHDDGTLSIPDDEWEAVRGPKDATAAARQANFRERQRPHVVGSTGQPNPARSAVVA